MRLVFCLVIAACVSPRSVTCPDGETLCPRDTLCVADPRLGDGVYTCAGDDQRAACDGRADGDVCDLAPGVLGECVGGACLPSDGTCNNNILDLNTGEQCDIADGRSHDGCSATCGLEQREWRAVPIEQFVTGNAQMVYDSYRDRIVLFGGKRRTTWEWDGVAWKAITPIVSPSLRDNAGMAFDAARRRVVLFGGRGNGLLLNDTWEYDGTTWTPVVPTEPPPPARSSMMMAYDAARGRVVMFGGVRTLVNEAGAFGDLWEWDGARWTRLAVEGAAPGPRKFATMTYDPRRGVLVMFGGLTASNTALDETWELSRTGWTLRTPAAAPPARGRASAAYDPATRRIVIHGGGATSAPRRDTWAWDGAAWIELEANGSGGAADAMSSSAREGSLLRVDQTGATLRWTGATWSVLLVAADPAILLPRPGIGERTVAADVTHRRLVTFGGIASGNILGQETHIWDGGRFRFPLAGAPPPGRLNAAMAYDAARDNFVMFGGRGIVAPPDDFGRLGDTWTFDGATWTQRTVAGAPPARSGAAIAYDPVRERVVMFGGEFDGAVDDRTWEWDGASWTSVATAGPPVLAGAVAAWDPSRNAIVMFGGRSAGGEDSRTWIYDGAWTELAVTVTPPPRLASGFAWNAPHRALTLFGGTSGGSPTDEVWELDAEGWHFISVAGPGARSSHTLFSLFDGSGVGSFGNGGDDELITLVSRSPAIDETCGRADVDGDGLVRCDDPDCAFACTSCGDGTCDAPRESCERCPSDCGSCAPVCGDGAIDPGEDAASCPGDACLAGPC